MEAEKQEFFKVPVQLLNSIMNYILTKPASEVLGFIKAVEKDVELIKDDEVITKGDE
jgi:hypothetical protein